jgi:hypothetical protein
MTFWIEEVICLGMGLICAGFILPVLAGVPL